MLSPLLVIVSNAEAREPRVFLSLEDEDDDDDCVGRLSDSGNILSFSGAEVFLLRFRSAIFRDGGIGIGTGIGRISFNGVCSSVVVNGSGAMSKRLDLRRRRF
jgi:hypothetical protein